MFITSWTIDIRMNIQIWLIYRRYKSEWYNFWWATIQDIAACACKVWTLFGQACGQEECSQTTMTTTMMTMTTMPMTTTDKSWLHRLATDILSWAKNHSVLHSLIVRRTPPHMENPGSDTDLRQGLISRDCTKAHFLKSACYDKTAFWLYVYLKVPSWASDVQ